MHIVQYSMVFISDHSFYCYTRMKSLLLFIVLLCTQSVCTGNQRKSVRKSSWGLLGKYQSLINDIYQIREAITDLIKGGLIKGEAGEAGVNGTQGSKGIKGEMGATGQTGLIGGMGDKGEKGDVGPKGERGEVSPSGAEDNRHAKGDTGLQGLRGDTGKM
ncbi:otolin-1-like isoform X2 [Crassostrea angulata]|uniref:otolin-1-like isoform X2 n=1 Tax=Magallana angulata TaxID=2784310 RepID=UPI0022B12D5D|nr:otolin-1-like isoform X2 [Crassostrea angulata]